VSVKVFAGDGPSLGIRVPKSQLAGLSDQLEVCACAPPA
jgi:hypothetical protein